MKKRIGLNGFIIFLALATTLFLRKFLLRPYNAQWEDKVVEIFGMGLIFFGMLLRVSSRGYKSERSKNGHALVTGGPYSLVRNPMYLGISCIGLGVIAVLFSWWAVFIFGVFMLVRYLTLIFKEESWLRTAFGAEYERYQKNVPRVLPDLRRLTKRKIWEYLPLRLRWVRRESGSMIAVGVAILLLKSWQALYIGKLREALANLALLTLAVLFFLWLAIKLSKAYENTTESLQGH